MREGADGRLATLLGLLLPTSKMRVSRLRDVLATNSITLERGELNPPGYVPLSNYRILDKRNLALREAVEGRYFTVKAGVSLDEGDLKALEGYMGMYSWEEAENLILAQAPNYARVYTYVFHSERLRRQAREMLGTFLYDGVLRKAFVVVGEPNIGKSVLADTYKRVMGELASSIPLSVLFGKDNRRVMGELAGKYVNITCESPEGLLRAVDWFKMVTGDEELTGEVKYERPFRFWNRIKLVIFCNEIPLFSRVDEAVLDRLYIIESEAESIPAGREDSALRERIRREWKYVFMHILLCYKMLEERGFKLLHAPSREEVLNYVKERAAIISEFIDLYCETGEGYVVKGTKFVEAFLKYCGEAGITNPPGRNTIYAQLSYLGFEKVLRRDGVYFKGLRLRDEAALL